MACACKETLPRQVPARDVGIRSARSSLGLSQLRRGREADAALRAPAAFERTRNAAYLGVDVHVGGARTGKEVKVSRFSPLTILALGGVLWLSIRAR